MQEKNEMDGTPLEMNCDDKDWKSIYANRTLAFSIMGFVLSPVWIYALLVGAFNCSFSSTGVMISFMLPFFISSLVTTVFALVSSSKGKKMGDTSGVRKTGFVIAIISIVNTLCPMLPVFILLMLIFSK